MKKEITLTILLSLTWSLGVSQDRRYVDSLKHELEISQNDTLKLLYLLRTAEAFDEPKPDSAYYYATEELRIAKKLNLPLNEALALNGIAYALKNMGNYPSSLQTYLSANAILEDVSIEQNILPNRYYRLDGFIKKPITPRMIRLQILGYNQLGIGLLYETVNNYDKALFYSKLSKQRFEEIDNFQNLCLVNMIIGRLYLSLNKKDSALIFERKAYDLSNQLGYQGNAPGISMNLGRIYLAMGNTSLAADYFRSAVIKSRDQGYLRGIVAGNLLLCDVYAQEGKRDSSVYFANEALEVAQGLNSPDLLLRTYTALADFYRSTRKNDSTVKYQSLIINMKDGLFNSRQAQQFQSIAFDDEQRRQELEAEKAEFQNRLWMNAILGSTFTLFVIAVLLFRNNRLKQRSKQKIEKAYDQLKSTQSQLIQSEKMASLGELTAGIAHEIQNPLNFVNNFSELNEELLSEMNEEIEKGNFAEAKSIAGNVINNQEKISEHGKRADTIVKGMLQHSRSSSGIKEPTMINTLVDEYVRLAYHGLRAKDKTFNVTLKTNLDEGIGLINIVPQDIGRVILNLLNNAFYAVSEKRKQVANGYEPIVSISTRKSHDNVLISVHDNGNGIAEKFIEKVFQPFFTTKPTGQGTGLGLSLSYDIVKAHNGTIRINTNQNEGAEFVVELPVG